jgi:hypothetical protein
MEQYQEFQKPTIEFSKKREFGELFNATFQFIREEIKILIKPLLYLVLPIALLMGFFGGLSQVHQMDYSFGDVTNPFDSITRMFNIYYFLQILCGMALNTVLVTLIYSYIKVYKDNDGKVELTLVYKLINQNLLQIFGYSIALGFLVIIGTMLFIIPGIYLFVSLQFIFVIKILDNETGESIFKRSFEIIKGYWWLSFGMLLILYLIVYIVSAIFSIPLAIIVGIGTWNSIESGLSSDGIGISSTIVIIAYCFSSLAYLLAIIPPVFLAFHYFNLVERKEATTLMEQISSIDDSNESDEA